jgi:hypothetical protein
VRVARARPPSNLKDIPFSLATSLLNDESAGARKWTLKALGIHRLPGSRMQMQEIANSDLDMVLRQLASQLP